MNDKHDCRHSSKNAETSLKSGLKNAQSYRYLRNYCRYCSEAVCHHQSHRPGYVHLKWWPVPSVALGPTVGAAYPNR